ncbi:MAG: class II fructose-bisphosphate aldolase [Pseudomonadota bacterium]
MDFPSISELVASLRDSVVFNAADDIYASDWKRFREHHLDRLTYIAVFHPDEQVRGFARWLIRTLGLVAGVVPASIYDFYKLKGEGKFQKITVPAFNLRGLTYDLARSLCRAALATNTRAFIFEISRSEIGYTDQRPAEYAAVILAAALREGFTGPVFLQGDHFQFDAERFRAKPEEETAALERLSVEAMEAGFFNLDIDASTLVEPNAATLEEQQKLNCAQTAHMIRFIRKHQPKDVTVAIGGEIGEVGKKKSTLDELRVFLDGTIAALGSPAGAVEGLSKVSVQTGTQHGGVPDADGKPSRMEVDFKTLEELSKLAISAYKLAGAVQHGASTLADKQFDGFPQANAAEIHLSTAFQNFVFDGGHFPEGLYQEIIDHLFREFGVQRRLGETDAQFLYRIRKRAFGTFKQRLWDLDEATRGAIRRDLQQIFEKLFRRLDVNGSLEGIVDNTDVVKAVLPLPEELQRLAVV